jgi:hypothetical protein
MKTPTPRSWSTLLLLLAFPALAIAQPAAEKPVPARIVSVTFDWSSHQRLANGSDNWPVTWSNDNHQYAAFGDGGGFGGSDADSRASFGIARIEGDRNRYTGTNLFGGKNAACASNIHGKAHGAPISLGGFLYAWVTPASDAKGFERFTLYLSSDKGCTWKKTGVAFELARDGVSFGSFVQFGKDNALASDEYLYTTAVIVLDASSLKRVQQPGKIALIRVPRASLFKRSAYQFFAGLDGAGQPMWTRSPRAKAPIYEDPTGVGPFPQMTYVPGLNRFVYSNQHGDGATSAGMRSRLTLADAANPWGPWTDFYRDVFFPQEEQTVFQWNFAPKWFSSDGREFTLIFSGVSTQDSWNTVNGVFTTRP